MVSLINLLRSDSSLVVVRISPGQLFEVNLRFLDSTYFCLAAMEEYSIWDQL